MEYLFNEKQLEIQATIRKFAQEEVAPLSEKMDTEQTSASPLLKKLAEFGYTACLIPKKYGGAELDFTSYCIILEEVAKVDPAVAACIAIQNASQVPLLLGGSEELKQKYLPRTASYEMQTCFCLTEENAGSDPAGMEMTAVEDGDYYILNGQKKYISMGDEGDVIGVMCRTSDEGGTHGISAFMVEKTESPFEVAKVEDKIGLRCCRTAVLDFKDVRVSKKNMIGNPGDGFKLGMTTLDGGRCGVGAIAVGTAEAALEEAIKHSTSRVQFGQKISQMQGIRFMVADMAMRAEAAKLLVYNACRMSDAGENFSVQASMAKAFAGRSAVQNCVDSVQIHGGKGLLKGNKIEKLYRDAKFLEVIEGTTQVQQVVVSRALLGR